MRRAEICTKHAGFGTDSRSDRTGWHVACLRLLGPRQTEDPRPTRMHLEGPVPDMRSPSETAATTRTAALYPALVAILIAALLLSLSLARPRETTASCS